jgi:hypothetical protein
MSFHYNTAVCRLPVETLKTSEVRTPHYNRVLPSPLARTIQEQFPSCANAQELFARFLSRSGYDSTFAYDLTVLARNSGYSWQLRCAAALMLENQMLLADSDAPLVALGAASDAMSASAMRHRLERHEHAHSSLRGFRTSATRLLDFILLSRRECKLSLAPYLFSEDEIAERILGQVLSSKGLPKPHTSFAPAGIGEFDGKLIEHLRADSRVLWVCEETSSELNSLVEDPISTVALVIKPPGSDMEFEVKRGGLRGARPLDALYERDGTPVPPSHRLQGGSYGFMLDYEARAGQRFSSIYRAVHGAEPPMSQMLGMTSIASVPNGGAQTPLVNYFSHRSEFGQGFDEMRDQMRRAVEAMEENQPRNDLQGPIGLTTRFILATVPNQAWIAGTTSFRLDRTAAYLSPRGPEIYFTEGLGRDFNASDWRRFAVELLEEVLGVVEPPEINAETFGEWVDASLQMPGNRDRADQAYLGCIADIGRYWGTLLAVGGFTDGESFVPRNVGIKSRFQDGRWRARICFMDHDGMRGLTAPGETPQPAWPIEGMRKDGDWICEDRAAPGEFDCLRRIYRVGATVEKHGEEMFRERVAHAYSATRAAMAHAEPVRSLFDPEYLPTLRARDEVIRQFLACDGEEAALKRWRRRASVRMRGGMYPSDLIHVFLDAVTRNRRTIERYAMLYESR